MRHGVLHNKTYAPPGLITKKNLPQSRKPAKARTGKGEEAKKGRKEEGALDLPPGPAPRG
jgi:hypothetical protein